MVIWDKFTGYLRDQKRYSVHTLRAYECDLAQFFKYSQDTYNISDAAGISPDVMRSYIVHLIESGLSRRSIQRKISSVKSFFNYLARHEGVRNNPASGLILPRTPNDLPSFVTREAMDDLWEQLPEASDYATARERMLLLLLYGTGMRLAELISLDIDNVDTTAGIVRVSGKRNKQRDIPLGKVLVLELTDYLGKRQSIESEVPALFVTDKGKRLYPKWVYNMVRTWLGRVTTQDKRSPHILRHSFATHMLNDGADLNAIKEILGHASLAATQVYTHNTIEKLRQVYEQAHPRA